MFWHFCEIAQRYQKAIKSEQLYDKTSEMERSDEINKIVERIQFQILRKVNQLESNELQLT